MRLSTVEGDPGFLRWAQMSSDERSKIVVLFNGTPQKGCVTADEEEGLIVLERRDDDGRFVIKGDRIIRDTLSGRVTIVFGSAL